MTSLTSVTSAVGSPAVSSGPVFAVRPANPQREATWTSVVTLLLWTGCVFVGGLGLFLPYRRPLAPVAPPLPSMKAELIRLELTTDPMPPANANPLLASALPPPLPTSAIPPVATPLLAVAEPNPLIAFALPVEGPTVTVDPAQASPRAAVAQADPTPGTEPSGTPLQLTFGQGDGRQPAPEYPRAARRSGQEGIVGVVFQVGPNGRVLSAEAVSASPWPLLNQAALRVIRERWQFSPGTARLFQVNIRFQLHD